MASVKFNRGNYGADLSGQTNALSFLRKTDAGAADYGYLYLGSNLVATKYLKELDITGFTAPTTENPLLVTLQYGAARNTIETTRIVKAAQVSAQSGDPLAYTYTPLDSDIMTAAAVAAYVTRANETNDKYHTTGTWGSTSSTWNTYTATPVNGAGALSFTLPTENSITASAQDKIPTSYAVAQYVAGLAGGMRYCGSATSTTLPTGTGTLAPYKSGDVFIAAPAPGDTTLAALGIEAGDMIVLNSTYTSGSALSATNCEAYERNLDGAVTKSTDLVEHELTIATGTSTIKSLTNGTDGQVLLMRTQKDASDNDYLEPAWVDYIQEQARLKSGTTDTIRISRIKNGALDSSYTYGGFENGVMDIQITSVGNATNANKVLEKAQTASTTRSLLVGYASVSPATDATEYKDVEYNSNATINNDGELTVKDVTITEKDGGTYGNTTIDVAEALTWHTLPTQSD